MKPLAGTDAPDFSVEVVGGDYAEGQKVSLNELRGQKVVLVFYPKDSTPGCTIQACAMRDDWGLLDGRAAVFGVSADGVASHQQFINKQNLPYPLLADTEKDILQAYGVWVEKSMFGKKYMGIERSTVVIDEDGRVMAWLEKVKPGKHLQDLLGVLD